MLELNQPTEPAVIPTEELRLSIGGVTGTTTPFQSEVSVLTLTRKPLLQSLVSGETLTQVDPVFARWLGEHFIAPHIESAKARPQTAESASGTAFYLIGAGRGVEALDLLSPWLGQTYFWADFAAARALESLGRISEAEATYRSMVARLDGDARAAGALGRFLVLRRSFVEAIEVLEPHVDKGLASVVNDYAAALIGLEKWRQAAKALRACLRLDDRNILALNNLGICFLRLQERERARSSFGAALAVDAHCLPALANLAELYIEEGRFNEALTLLERAPKEDVAAVERQGWCWLKLNNVAQAKRLLTRTVDLTHRLNPITLTNLGAVTLLTQNFAEAEVCFREACRLAPSDVLFALNLARLLHSRRRIGESVSVLAPWEFNPQEASPELLMFLGTSLMQLSEVRRASAVFEQAIAVFPDVAGLWANYGYLLMNQLNDLPQAIKVMRAGFMHAPADLLLRNNLAYALLRDGQSAEARALLKDVIRELPDTSDTVVPCVFATWGLLLIREGNYSDGIAFYERAVRLASDLLKDRLRKRMLIEEAREAIARGRNKNAQLSLDRAMRLDGDPELDAEARLLRVNTLRH